ncbi:hypothetical protein VVD49_05690 [Uliginosibacterium sp. H3]|uniref:Uncharacterized protein n=1 Tax=Uliginosibacterium silvisoli TaxID=3114758 RepID=A0ABU6K1W6_9RHOO|nr:hypothetical protein [Uliginosibacterium sp. H3]
MAEQTTQSWWQTLPGIMTAAAGCISAITALIIALHQAGLFKAEDKAAEPSPAAVLAAEPPAAGVHKGGADIAQPAGQPGPATGQDTSAEHGNAPSGRLGAPDDKALLAELEQANVGNSVGKGAMLSWLGDDDRTYRRISLASARLLDGKRLKGTATDLDVIKYHYLEAVGLSGDGQLPVDAQVDDARLRQAIITAFNDKNGTSARRLEAIVEVR